MIPVTEDPSRSRRRQYRILDNFLAFWLGWVDRYRSEIERGLGGGVAHVLEAGLNDAMGPVWEEAFRLHLRRMAADGTLGPDIVAVGPWWTEGRDPAQMDAVVLAGRSREAVLVGEAKWARSEDGAGMLDTLRRKAERLPRRREPLTYALCARTEVTGVAVSGAEARRGLPRVLVTTARDVFGPG